MSTPGSATINDDLTAGLPTEEPTPRKRAPKSANDKGDRKTIIIAESDNPKDTHVFVSVNGYAYNIQRGAEVPVPPEVIHVLENAIEARLVKNAAGGHELKSFHRYPFRVVG